MLGSNWHKGMKMGDMERITGLQRPIPTYNRGHGDIYEEEGEEMYC